MILRATVIDRNTSWGYLLYGDAPRVVVRLEIQWSIEQGFFNLGLHYYSEDEWLFILALLILGTRAVQNVDIECIDRTKENDLERV